MIGTLIVVAKEPVPGRVKTRLVPPLTYEQAAEVALAAIVDTLRSMSCVPAERHLLALDGRAGSWLPPGWDTVGQPVGELDARLIGAFGHADQRRPAVLVGMDTPSCDQSRSSPSSRTGTTRASGWPRTAATGRSGYGRHRGPGA